MIGEQEAVRKSFYVVYVPTEVDKELEEWSISLPDNKEAQIGCLTERLRQHFKESSQATKSEAEQQQIFKQQLLSKVPQGAKMDENMLQMMLQVIIFVI